MTTDDYYRLNYTDNAELSDFLIESSKLTSEEIKFLITDKKQEIIDNANNNEENYKIWYNLYNFVPDWVMSQLYNEIIAMPKSGVMKMFLDHEIHGTLFATKLLVGTLEAYNIRSYKDKIEAGFNVVLTPKALSRTEGTKSIGDMSISFESERLGIKIDTPFEQYLSTLPNGIEIMEEFKNYQSIMPVNGVV